MQLKHTKSLHHYTKHLDLTLNETEVYLFLLQNGLTKGAEIPQRLNMDKSSSYRALNNLVQRNLAYKIGQERNQKFAANPPSKLLDQFDVKQKELANAKSDIQNLLKDLDDYARKNYKQHNITIFQGEDGFRQWNQARLIPQTKIIREISERQILEPLMKRGESYDKYMVEYIQQRVNKDISIRVLVSERGREDNIDISTAENLKEVRILPPGFHIRAMVSTWANATGFISNKDGTLLSIIIQDDFIENLITNMYDLIWELSNPKPPEDHKAVAIKENNES